MEPKREQRQEKRSRGFVNRKEQHSKIRKVKGEGRLPETVRCCVCHGRTVDLGGGAPGMGYRCWTTAPPQSEEGCSIGS